MSGTYYNLPTISCDNRNKTWPEASKASICNNLNPDKIYNSLFPCDSNPMQAYPKNNNNQIPNNIYNNSILKKLANQTNTSCARECNNNNDCAAFSIQNNKNKCELYKVTEPYKPSDRYERESVNNKISIFQYNNVKGDDDCDEGCIKDKMQAFTQATPPLAPQQWNNNDTAEKSYDDIPLDDCKKRCIENPNICNTIVFTEHDNSCNLYEKTSNSPTTITNKGYDTYIKDPSRCNNILGFDIKDSKLYNDYYKEYKNGGKNFRGAVGDYFCDYNSTVQKCFQTKKLSCTPDSPQCLGQTDTQPKKRDTGGGASACLAPLCDPNTGQHVKHKIKGIRINEYVFQNCQEEDSEGHCIDDIYTFDDLGLPISQNTSNPPTKNFLYTRDYDVKDKFKIINCPKGFDVIRNTGDDPTAGGGASFSGEYLCQKDRDTSTTCIPVGSVIKGGQSYPMCQASDYMLNIKKAFKTKEECQQWCSANSGCVGLVSSYDDDGNLLCSFYKKVPERNIKKVEKVGTQLFTKRSDPYVYNPKGEVKKKFQIPPNTNYKGWKPNNPKFNSIYQYETQCGAFGCCADGITVAKDEKGSNCDEFPLNSPLVGGKNYPIQEIKLTALGGKNHRVPVETDSGSSYINYMSSHGLMETFTNNKNVNTHTYVVNYIIIFFIIVVAVLIAISHFKN